MSQALPFIVLWLAGLALWCQPPAAPAQPDRRTRWHRRPPAWVLTCVLAWGLAWSVGLLDARGAIAILACIALSAWWHGNAHRHEGTWVGALAPWGIGALALALALHAVPGVHNPLVLDGVHWRVGDPAFSLRASFDKACAGLMLLATVVPRGSAASPTRRTGRHGGAQTAQAAALTTAATLGLAWAWGLTEPARAWPQVPGQPHALPLFLALNLFVTCVAEEAFFRGLLQSALSRRLATRGSLGIAAAIALPAALFGLAHLAGGPKMALLATLVGLGSGWAFARTRRIEAAVLVHFAVNAVHLLAFTYPARAA